MQKTGAPLVEQPGNICKQAELDLPQVFGVEKELPA